MKTCRINGSAVAAFALICLGFLAQPAWAYRDYIHMTWEGLPTGVKPANEEVYFLHNEGDNEYHTMNDAGTVQIGDADVVYWGGSLHVPSTVSTPEGRSFHHPEITLVLPEGHNHFIGEWLYYDWTREDYTTGNVESGGDDFGDYYITVAYTEQFKVSQFYSGITKTPPEEMLKDKDTTFTLTTPRLLQDPADSGNWYICTGWTGGSGVAPDGTTNSVTVSTVSENVTLTWVYERAWRLDVTNHPVGFTGVVNRLIENTTKSLFSAVGTNGLTYYNAGEYRVSVDQAIPSGSDRYFCLGYEDAILKGALSEGTGTAEDGRVKVTFTLDQDSKLAFVYELQSSMGVAFDASVPADIRSGAVASPPAGSYWFKKGTNMTASVRNELDDIDGRRWVCTGWTGSGNVPATGTNETVTFTLNQASVITWKYQRVLNYTVAFLNLPAAYQGSGFSPPSGVTRFYLGTAQTLTAPATISGAEGERFICEGWTGTGDLASPGSGTSNRVPVASVTQASSITWKYRRECRLRISVDPPSLTAAAAPVPSGTNWYLENTIITALVNKIASGSSLVGAAQIGAAQNATVFSDATRRGRIFTLTADAQIIWQYTTSQHWTVGAPIVPPDGASSNEQPSVEVVISSHSDDTSVNTFFFGGPAGRKLLYPLRPVGSALITWKPAVAGGADIVSAGYSTWPTNMQLHVGSIPVSLQATNYSFIAVKFAENDASGSNKTFYASTAGNSLLQFVQGAMPDPINSSSRFVAVKTVLWNDSDYLAETNWPIGSAITNRLHADTNHNGYVFFTRAFYDPFIYRRDTRLGPIIPVNRDTNRDDDDMVVTWFTRGDAALGLYWPTVPVRYTCQWPDQLPGGTVNSLVIASQRGSGPMPASLYPRGQVYVQPEPSLPGYNPNEEHAALFDQGGSPAVFALRNDLNAFLGASEPYVLFKYDDPVLGRWAMKVYKVLATDATYSFSYPAVAGQPILPPTPLSLLMPLCPQSAMSDGSMWYHLDHKGGHWAKAAAPDGGASDITMRWYYPMQAGFYYPDFNYDGTPDAVPGDPIPLLNGGANHVAQPVSVVYAVTWPSNNIVSMALGETLLKKKVPVFGMAAAEVLYDENLYRGIGPLVKLVDPLSEHWVSLEAVPAVIKTEQAGARRRFPDLPYYLKCRLSYDPLAKRLYFGGVLDESGMGDPLLLPNIMSRNERQRLQDASTEWAGAIGQLFAESRNPHGIEYAGASVVTNLYNPALTYSADAWITLWGETQYGLRQLEGGNVRPDRILGLPKALTAGAATGTGWVTLVENDDVSLGAAPVQLHIIKVLGEPVIGQIQVIKPDNVFDEKLTLRHSPDFGGDPDKMVFEWWYQPDTTGFAPPLPDGAPVAPGGEWKPFASGQGLQEVTIEGASPLTLADNWFAVRYTYANAYPFYTNTVYGGQKSLWAGQPGTDRKAQLAEGWIKRVVAGLNPFDARVLNFHAAAINTTISMIGQLGGRYEGPIPFNGDPNNLNAIGLIEAYQTVLDRGLQFSVNAGINYGPANSALLNISTRLSDFYMLLGNEAYQDALDPTIGFGTASGEYGTLAPSIFAFQNQVPSQLDEELVLLRGRDDSAGPVGASPVYNRFIWNFTQGEGEAAYAQCYNISDQITFDSDNNGYRDDTDGVINELDAKVMYPQGHGDAWGHYLTAMRYHYNLLREPLFTWESRPEAVLVAGVPVTVDYLDERKFARAAAAKARVGAEIVNLTYRQNYVDDPAGQWQGYKDTDRDRAWGLDDWARRAGQGAYFDWVVANGMLPAADPDPTHTGIAKIDRTTVSELGEIAAYFGEIQGQIDKADKGLNPIGLAKNVVPFDIDPALVFAAVSPKTHFEQMYDRAIEAMKNAVSVFDYANQMTQMLRRNEDTRDQFDQNIRDQERDYINRLIEIFGYAYPDDIGPGGSYPSGYEGPDWLHFMYVDPTELTGVPIPSLSGYDVVFDFSKIAVDQPLGVIPAKQTVQFTYTSDGKYMVKPASWSAPRRAQGEIQRAISDFILAQAALEKSINEFDKGPMGEIENQRQLLESKYQANLEEIRIMKEANEQIETLDRQIETLHWFQLTLNRLVDGFDRTTSVMIEAMPKVVGAANDVTSGARSGLLVGSSIVASCVGLAADQFDEAELAVSLQKDSVSRNAELMLLTEGDMPDLLETYQAMGNALGDAEIKRMEISVFKEQMQQASARVLEVMAKGQRLLEERAAWRKNNAPEIQDYRYQDMTFRAFRNDALQKYRAQYDLAARYVYLAATAYDYETCLLGGQNGSGRQFLTDIVRHRALGQMINGAPVVGRPGLADPLARLGQNFAVYKTQLGFNNPQTETSRFSLRQELFRIKGTNTSDEAWRNVLAASRVPDLWAIPEYRKYCRPFAEQSAGVQPGLVIRFSSCVQFGRNFFGWPLGGGDSTYDPTHFATKIRNVGTWFANYNGQGLSQTPRVYLVPTGADIMRSPSGDTLATREWKVVDQKLPVPFPIGDADMKDQNWIPINDSLSEDYGGIRRFSRYRAYHDSGAFTAAETVSDSRLIGRSVWNTEWMLIIPGETLLNPAGEGLDTFIYGQPVPGGGGERDGNGVKDIKLFFQTYAYSGN